VIATGLSALGDSASMTERERETIKRLDRTATRMHRMIEQVMVVAQTLGGEVIQVSRGEVDLGELVTQVIHDTRQTGAHEIDVEITLTDKIKGDADKLNRLIENLVVNAIRHGNGAIAIGVYRDGDNAVLAVKNGGTPIPPELQDKLFDPYTRSRSSGGAGLGLYIVKQIARAHGGAVAVSSTTEGTTFTVTLPIARAS
jgi:signal transduction histidine kinase